MGFFGKLFGGGGGRGKPFQATLGAMPVHGDDEFRNVIAAVESFVAANPGSFDGSPAEVLPVEGLGSTVHISVVVENRNSLLDLQKQLDESFKKHGLHTVTWDAL